MAEASLGEDLDECHKVFAGEVVRALNKFYKISVDLAQIPGEGRYLTDGIYWGIIAVAYLLREKNLETFKSLSKGLKNENYFYECCMFIPTERNDRYFFNFLKRVSIIYEMAVFCYRNNDNYIETARNCIAQFQDKEYFKSVGSWKRLSRIGYFLTIWSKVVRPVMIKEIHQIYPVLSTTSDEVVELYPEEKEKLEDRESSDKDFREDLTSDISCPVERKREYNSALVLLLADEITDMRELGSIEDEIKSIMRYLKPFLPHRFTKHLKELSKDSKNQNSSRTESPHQQTSSTRIETSSTKRKTSGTRRKKSNRRRGPANADTETKNSETVAKNSETVEKNSETVEKNSETVEKNSETVEKNSETANVKPDPTVSLFCERLADEMSSSLTEKMTLKAKYEELMKVVEETKECFQESAGSSKREEKIGYSAILEEDLYLSDSSKEENSEDLRADKDCNENNIPSTEDLRQISDNTESDDDDDDYIKDLEYDLFCEAKTFVYTTFSHGSDTDDTEPYSAMNSLADEGDSDVAQNNNLSSEVDDSSTMNIKSEVKNNDLPLSKPTGSSASAPFVAEDDTDSSSESNNEEKLVSTKSAKSNSSEGAGKHDISNKNNAKSQQRKTKRRRKRGKSKK